jgi:putative transposase
MNTNKKCKYCGSEKIVKNGKVKGKQVHKCKTCGKRFFLNGKFARMKNDKSVIVTALNLYFDGLSLRKTQQNLKQIFGEKVTQVTILNWIKKYANLVKEYVRTLTPQLSGLWHEDETMLPCEGRNIWFWEMIDEDTKFLVASHLSGTRTFEDTVAIFKKGFEQSKVRPRAVFVDGSHVYNRAFNKVFYTMRKATRPELVQRVGVRTRETNNIVERLHGTLKDRTKPMRGLKSYESTKLLLEGYSVHYNCVRPHQSLGGKTPAQAARMEVPNNWKGLIDEATKYEAMLLAKVTNTTNTVDQKSRIEAIVK